MRINIDNIITDAGTQMRAVFDSEVAAEYAEQMRAGAKFPPVSVTALDDGRYVLWDGFTRLAAVRLNGWDTIEAEVTEGTRQDAFELSLGANARNGQRRTNADKRNAVEAALRNDKVRSMSNVAIAKLCLVSDNFVKIVRLSILEPFEDNPAERVVSRGGKSYTMDTTGMARGSSQVVHEEAPCVAARHAAVGCPAVTGIEEIENGVVLGDALEVMGHIESGSVALIVTSPEYPGQRANSMSVPEWFSFMRDVFAEASRILRPNGVMAFNIMFKRDDEGWFDHRLFDISRELAVPAGFRVADTYMWDKLNPPPSGPMERADIPAWEFVYVFAKSRGYQFVPQLGDYSKKSLTKAKDGNKTRGEGNGYEKGHSRVNGLGARQHNVLRISSSGEVRPRAAGGSFPTELAERFILQHTSAGDLVFDPFCGAGTVLVTAKENGRRWYGCDISTTEVEKARQWVR